MKNKRECSKGNFFSGYNIKIFYTRAHVVCERPPLLFFSNKICSLDLLDQIEFDQILNLSQKMLRNSIEVC